MQIFCTMFFCTIFFSQILRAQDNNQKLNRYIPQGYTLLDSKSGDLNQDGLTDYVIICKDPNEMDSEEELQRPVLILHGTTNGGLQLFARNDNVALSYYAGGPIGDPYTGMTLKKNFFSIEHEGGSNFRFIRIMTFKYDKDRQQYLLHKDAGETYNTTNPNKSKSESYNKKQWGKMLFTDYSNQ